jgi:hypothetical protein
LVNDLDLFVKNVTTGEVWHPWVLSSYPNKDSLSSIAKRGIDTLNNIEQVTIENLAPGIYIITIKGSNITTPNQLFAVAYQMDVADAFEWIFPNATDIIIPNRYNVIRWQTKINQMSRLEFSYNGSDWNLISDGVDLGKQYYKWAVPDSLATAQLRIKLPGPHIYISDSFAICKAANLNVGFNCPDSLLLFWNKLPIDQYQIYYLGNKYLEPFRIVKDTFIVIAKKASPSFNYSVASLINNKAGLRSYTINYENAAVECYFKSFYLQAQNNERNLFAAVIGTLFNVDSISLQKLKDRHFGTIKTLQKLTGISFTFEDSSLTRGLNTYRLQIKLKNGSFIYSNEIKTYHFRDLATIIYPNPSAQGKALNIITDGNNKTNIEIYSSTGALIFGIPLINTLTQLQTYRLPKGIYFVSIITEDGNKSMQKLIVY